MITVDCLLTYPFSDVRITADSYGENIKVFRRLSREQVDWDDICLRDKSTILDAIAEERNFLEEVSKCQMHPADDEFGAAYVENLNTMFK